jgi:hypothetical protein
LQFRFVKDLGQPTGQECWERSDIICYAYHVKTEEIAIMNKLNWDVHTTSPYNLANDLVFCVRSDGWPGFRTQIMERCIPFIDAVVAGQFIPRQ